MRDTSASFLFIRRLFEYRDGTQVGTGRRVVEGIQRESAFARDRKSINCVARQRFRGFGQSNGLCGDFRDAFLDKQQEVDQHAVRVSLHLEVFEKRVWAVQIQRFLDNVFLARIRFNKREFRYVM